MSALDTTLNGRIVHNGKVTVLPRAKLHMHLQRFVAYCKSAKSNGLSSLRLETSVAEFTREAAGETEEESLMRQILEGVEVEDTPVDERWSDPQWTKYQSMHNKRNIERETPESLARLRLHIESRYPEHVAEHGHHF